MVKRINELGCTEDGVEARLSDEKANLRPNSKTKPMFDKASLA
jgi:hypothetical protein